MCYLISFGGFLVMWMMIERLSSKGDVVPWVMDRLNISHLSLENKCIVINKYVLTGNCGFSGLSFLCCW